MYTFKRMAVFGIVACGALLAAVWPSRQRPAGQRPSPFLASVLPAAQRFDLTADVVERLKAGPYVYFHARDHAGRLHWIASLAATSPPAPVRIRAQVLGRANDFQSRRLSRRFDTLLFAVVQEEKEK
jgi:hypothetical protein